MILVFPMSYTTGNSRAPSTGEVSAGPAANTIEGEISLIKVDGTILIRSISGEAIVVEPQVDTKIIRNGKSWNADELTPGDKVRVWYVPDSHEALSIRAAGQD